jgi:hypothetical protein
LERTGVVVSAEEEADECFLARRPPAEKVVNNGRAKKKSQLLL